MAWLYVTLALAALLASVPYLGALASGGAVVLQLWGPLGRADRTGAPTTALGLQGHRWQRQLVVALSILVLLLPLWTAVTGVWPNVAPSWLLVPHVAYVGPVAAPQRLWPAARWALEIFNQLVGVALPEEVFWRGYVQPVLETWAGPRRQWAIMRGNRGTLLATALFALGHVVGGAGALSLATFWPGLLFAAAASHFESLVAAVLLHAACNVWAALILGTPY